MIDRLTELMQNMTVMLEAELLLRVIIAVFCGAFIGYERTNRGKEAGIRTHTIVAVASCLMMIISQYGFGDFFSKFNIPGVDMRLDPSRVAAQIVSGIGFLGAGMIFVQKNVVTGLTTAAGIWAVAGIGMAIGCGMYFIAIMCTIIIILIQWIMHKSAKFTNNLIESEMSFEIEDSMENIDLLLNEINKFEITILEASYDKTEENYINVTLLVQYNQRIDKTTLTKAIYAQNNVKSAKL